MFANDSSRERHRAPARVVGAAVMMTLAGLIGACGHNESPAPATTSSPSVTQTEKSAGTDGGANKFTPTMTAPVTTPPLNSGNSGYNGPGENNNGGPKNNNGGGPGGAGH